MDSENPDEYYDGGDPEYDADELNKQQLIQRHMTSRYNQTTIYENVNPKIAYNEYSKIYDNNDIKKDYKLLEPIDSLETIFLNNNEKNPIFFFNNLQEEINLIEEDLDFYSKNKKEYKSEISIEKSIEELKKLKILSNYILKSKNYFILNELYKIQNNNSKFIPANKYNIFNKEIYENLNKDLNVKTKEINDLKNENINNFKDFEYELFITPNKNKIKLFKKILEIKDSIDKIENTIGQWNYDIKKKSISTTIYNIKNRIQITNSNFQTGIDGKLNDLKIRLNNMNFGKENLFSNKEGKNKIDKLYSKFISSKGVENTINQTIHKMENLKNNHEDFAFINLKLKNIIDEQEKIAKDIIDNNEILDNLKENIDNNVLLMKNNLEFLNKKSK